MKIILFILLNWLCSTSNAVPPTQEAYEHNEKIINEIYLSTTSNAAYKHYRSIKIANAAALNYISKPLKTLKIVKTDQ